MSYSIFCFRIGLWGRFLFSREFKSIRYRKIPIFHLQNRTIKIRPLKSKNPLKNQGICGRYLFHRPFMAQAEGFEPPCRLGKRFSRPPRCDHFDKPAYEILLNTRAFEVTRRRRIQFATFGGRRNKPAYFLKFVFRILARGEYLR